MSNLRDLKWSKVIRRRDNEKCRWCGRPGGSVAHFIPRKRMGVRYVLENGWCACSDHHKRYDKSPKFRKLVIKILLGEVTYYNLREVADGKKDIGSYGFTEVDCD